MNHWNYDGEKVDHGHERLDDQTVELSDGRTYWVQHGYYVPYYPVSEEELGEEAQLELADNMATDLATRFFRSAEVGINVRFSWDAIEALKAEYKATKDPEEKRAQGALLAGAIVARMERLAHASIAERAGGDINHYLVTKEIGLSIKEQLNAHTTTLMGLEEGLGDIVSQVRLRGGKEDGNGLLKEMAGEVAQSSESRLMERLNHNRAVKIGHAMKSMDEVAETTYRIFRTDWPYEDTKMLALKMARELKPTFETLTACSRRRAGIKSGDAENYVDVYSGQNAILSRLRVQLNDFRDQCEASKTEALDSLITLGDEIGKAHAIKIRQNAQEAEHMRQLLKALDLVEEGAEMIMDMSEVRMSHREEIKKGTTSIDKHAKNIARWNEELKRESARQR